MLTDFSFTATLIWIIWQELATFNVKGSFSEQFVTKKKKSMEPQHIFEPYNEDDTEEILKSVLVMAPVLSLDLPDYFSPINFNPLLLLNVFITSSSLPGW